MSEPTEEDLRRLIPTLIPQAILALQRGVGQAIGLNQEEINALTERTEAIMASDTPLLDRLTVGARVAFYHGNRRLEGVIAAVVPADTAPAATARTLELASHHCHYGGRPRGDESYLVRVDEPGDPVPHVHWPWTWRLIPANDGGANDHA